jgi:hypothetical protein
MLGQSIWWGSIALESLLLARGFRSGLAGRFPVFFSYVAFVLMQDLICLSTYSNQRLYNYSYWTTEFLCVLVGGAVVFEIYKVGLQSAPGTARMARTVLAFIFALALAKAITNAWIDPRWWLQASTLEIERALRAVGALSIFALIALFLFYAIPFGKNLRGILLGYGLFIAVRLITLVFVSEQGKDFWFYAYSASYPVALCIWLGHLWSYNESPAAESLAGRLEADYQRVAAATLRRLQSARGQLARAVRS